MNYGCFNFPTYKQAFHPSLFWSEYHILNNFRLFFKERKIRKDAELLRQTTHLVLVQLQLYLLELVAGVGLPAAQVFTSLCYQQFSVVIYFIWTIFFLHNNNNLFLQVTMVAAHVVAHVEEEAPVVEVVAALVVEAVHVVVVVHAEVVVVVVVVAVVVVAAVEEGVVEVASNYELLFI